MTDQPDWTTPVAIVNTPAVTISGTAVVSISGTPTVIISGTPSVNVANTPAVTISGTITANITSGTVNVATAAGVTVQAAGALRYIGALAWSGDGTYTQPITLGALERAIVCYVSETVRGTGTANIQLIISPNTGTPQTYNHFLVNNGNGYAGRTQGAVPCVGYANPGITSSWQVQLIISSNAGGTGSVYIFADTSLPERALYNPFSSDFMPVAIGSPVIYPPGTDGPGNQISVRVHGSAPYDSMLQHAPANGVLATITFTANPGLRWVIDHAEWSIRNSAATATAQLTLIKDGATVIYEGAVSIPATATIIDRDVLGPGAGYAGSIGNAVTVTFGAAPVAGVTELVTAGAFLTY